MEVGKVTGLLPDKKKEATWSDNSSVEQSMQIELSEEVPEEESVDTRPRLLL